ncbi:MAG TPA: hypothetical protein VLX85_05575 [Stellaceae bacterium]|nr:hypothetical protein [Stellaceae bacterium]
MRNGEGDGWFCVFRIWPGVLENVPAAFAHFLTEPAFAMEETTFCFWRERRHSAWQRRAIAFPDAPDPDGSAAPLAMLDGDPATYHGRGGTKLRPPDRAHGDCRRLPA